jgi:hypothetical protein
MKTHGGKEKDARKGFIFIVVYMIDSSICRMAYLLNKKEKRDRM